MNYLIVLFGLAALLIGGEGLVRGAVTLAERAGVSKMIIGLTIVSFGTSAPELFISVQAAIDGHPGLALGNVVGSNIANVLLVFGVPALILPIVCDLRQSRRDGVAMLAATVVFIVLCWIGPLTAAAGLLFLGLLFLLVIYLYRQMLASPAVAREFADEASPARPASWWLSVLFLIGGAIALVVGAHYLILGATAIAQAWGVSDAVIGITMVALGTSMPELVTAIVAAVRRHGDVVLGNVIGSNVINILGILGVTSLLVPIPIPEKLLDFDLWILLFSGLALYFLIWLNRPIGRITGFVFVVLYGAYVALQFVGMSGV